MTRARRRGLLAAFAAAAVIAAVAVGWSAAASPYAPVQPIEFHHRDHLETDHLACEVCHSGVRRSAFAGMPPVERCMGCHRFVATQHPDVVTLRRYYDSGTSIPWVKVNALPRFVRFSHEAHYMASIACERCHGNVATMDRVAQAVPLTMGWCVRCHRETHAPDDCLTCHY
jgi:hypothetical protein